MYDNIRLLLPYPFICETEKDTFCSRFNLFVKDEKKGILHNKGYEGLEQNKGIYIKIELPTENRKGSFTLSFSLHKLYNAMKYRHLYNYNDFSFENANEANKLLTDLIKIDLRFAIVKQYEVGINITTPLEPDDYMKELNHITVNGRKMRILEDLHYKEYKQFSTNKNKDKRIVYIFYNKTFEARSKTKDKEKRGNVPDNILRIEKDIHRPTEKLYFNQLFESNFQQLTKQEFKQRFVEDLECKKYYVKTKEISNIQLDIIKCIDIKGVEQTLKEIKDRLDMGVLTKKQYRYARECLNKIVKKNIKVERITSKTAKILKQLIINKLNDI
jgi:hypothetical protein